MLWFPVVQVEMGVMWNKPDSLFYVPVWIIILAVLAGLLLLSLLIYLLYKVRHCTITREMNSLTGCHVLKMNMRMTKEQF